MDDEHSPREYQTDCQGWVLLSRHSKDTRGGAPYYSNVCISGNMICQEHKNHKSTRVIVRTIEASAYSMWHTIFLHTLYLNL